jgi:hypothetical protein
MSSSRLPPAAASRKHHATHRQHLAASIRHASADDARWFAARPDRRHRVRHAVAAEIVAQGLAPLPEGYMHFTVVRQIERGIRLRALLGGESWSHTDSLTEQECSEIFSMAIGRVAS